LFLRWACADQIADNHQPGGDPDARLQFDGFDIKATDSVDGPQPRPNRPLGIVLVGLRIAEIDQHAIAHIPTDEAIESGNDFGDGAVIGGDDPPQILGIKASGELRRADQIAKHHRELAAFGAVGAWWRRRGRRSVKRGLPNGPSAAAAEFRCALVLEAAGGARRGQWRSAFRAKASRRHVFCHAT
jgi:hypothetical protein